jgi:diguanylate cyclase (GGDEF)-like protein/PAS domain S-box-containing protein
MERAHAQLAQLSAQSQRLEALERRIAELERERDALREAHGSLGQELELLRRVREDWEWFFDNSLDVLCIAGLNGRFERVNRSFTQLLGYSAEELVSKPFVEFVHPDDVEGTLRALQGLGGGCNCVDFENRYRDSQGQWHWLSWRCPALTPTTTKLFAIATDITEAKRSQAEVLHRALHDSLTDLFNRAAFDMELGHAIARTARAPTRQVALLVIDLDGFKAVNDTYGHVAGDRLLQRIAARMKSVQRSNEFVGRLGGDEFGWLVEGQAPIDLAPLGDRIATAICQPVPLPEAEVTVGCSIGCAVFPGQADDPAALLAQADAAMYAMKKRHHAAPGR